MDGVGGGGVGGRGGVPTGKAPTRRPRSSIPVFRGQVSTPFCAETIEASDCYLFAGPIINDYTTVGYSLLIKPEKMIIAQPGRVSVAGRRFFNCIHLPDFLNALAKRIKRNDASWINHQRM